MPDLVLASSSPRRALLLSSAGFTFSTRIPAVDETPADGEAPERTVVRLARAKALGAATPGAVALGADTAVVLDGETMGKPATAAEARSMIERLSGRTHVVITGWALAADGAVVDDGFETTLVTMRALDDGEIDAYVASGEPMDKAGAYAIQGAAKHFVTGIAGPRSNVIGLPLTAVVPALRRAGIEATSVADR